MNAKHIRNVTLAFALSGGLCLSCNGGKEPAVSVQQAITLNLNSGSGICTSIDTITSNPTLWTQQRFDSINNAINSLSAANRLNKRINEHKKHLANLLTSSAVCLEKRVDAEFKKPVYSNYKQLKDDWKFLHRYHEIYLQAGIDVEAQNPSLDKTEDIFKQYEHVLKLSRSTFYQEPQFLESYKQDYKSTEKNITSNRYYSVYFNKNTEITKGVQEFRKRFDNAKRKYYMGLESIIEKKAIKEELTYEQLTDIESTFYKFAPGSKAYDKLSNFVKARQPENQ